MKYLVDANVLSEPTKPAPDGRVIEWLRAHEPDIADHAHRIIRFRDGKVVADEKVTRQRIAEEELESNLYTFSAQ